MFCSTLPTRGCCWLVLTLVVAGCGKSSSDTGTSATINDGASGAGLKRVILLTNGADPFWDAMRAGMQDAEKDFKLYVEGERDAILDQQLLEYRIVAAAQKNRRNPTCQ